MTIIDELINSFSPHIYFHKNEVCYPINIDTYLQKCEIKSKTDLAYIDYPIDQKELYSHYLKNTKDLYLALTTCDSDSLRGDPNNAPCYVKVIPVNENKYLLIYFYFFSHTIPYKACGCCCDLNSYAHQADMKSIGVLVEKNLNTSVDASASTFSLSKVYFDAHGSQSGVWKNNNEIKSNGTHPVAYSCKGDHSFYYDSGCHPRIFGVVYDICAEDTLCTPIPTQVYNNTDTEFNQNTMGALYFPGDLGPNGINCASTHSFWTGNYPITSNNWFKRLFCPNYF